MKSNSCRSCGSERLKTVLDLGKTPLADALLKTEDLDKPEERFPLEAAFCADCGLMQILETVPPEVLFCREYPYFSSFSERLLEHSRENALDLIKQRNLGPDSFVVEIASNDGYLLRNFVEKSVPCLGIDPAEGPSKAASEAGVPTLNSFFSSALAEEFAGNRKKADVVIANNVLAHVADTNGFVAGLRTLLKDEGVAVLEVPYVRNLIDNCEFDTIYHEHLCYFSLTSLDRLFKRHGLFINDVKKLSIHGGSLRIYAEIREKRSGEAVRMLKEEQAAGLDQYGYYESFSGRVEHMTDELVDLLRGLKEGGARIAAYGAAAKGATLINRAGIGTGLIDFVADRNTHKHGKYMPGQRIPICGPEKITETMPDYVLILAWNFAEEIIAQQDTYRQRGGRFILPIPSRCIV